MSDRHYVCTRSHFLIDKQPCWIVGDSVPPLTKKVKENQKGKQTNLAQLTVYFVQASAWKLPGPTVNALRPAAVVHHILARPALG
jgi:hypothetical protein